MYKVLCVSYEKSKIGAACYDESEHAIEYLRDTTDNAEFDTLKYFTNEVPQAKVPDEEPPLEAVADVVNATLTIDVTQPDVTEEIPVFTPHSTQEKIKEAPAVAPPVPTAFAACDIRYTETVEEEEPKWFAALQFLSRNCFTMEEGKKWLMRILDYDERDAETRLKILFDTEEKNLMCAIGALLRHVNQLSIGCDASNAGETTAVRVFKAINLGDVVDVDRSTLRALEVFECESDNKTKTRLGRNRRKNQQRCLFDFCNLCRSTAGKRKLKNWFARPLMNREILRLRLDAVSWFQQDCHSSFSGFLRAKLRHVVSLDAPMARMRMTKLSVTDWCNILKTMKTLVEMGDSMRQYELTLPILGPGEKALGPALARLLSVLDETFDVATSINEHRFVCKKGISEELDELKARNEELGDHLTAAARNEIHKYGFQSCSVCYLPIIGYMVVVPHEDGDEEPAIMGDVEKMYTAKGSVGYKTPGMHDLDHKFGDLHSKIIDRETLIINSLQTLMIERKKVIYDAIEVAAIIDCLISLALVARENDWVRPRFLTESVINITKARHPIAEKICDGIYVSNPIQSGHSAERADYTKVKLITGANASGKSVYLKMVGSVLYLAHVGSYVPAERAEIGPINRILSRMYTIDLVLNGMSSFTNDLKQMSDAVRKADGNSVIIIDEFGKGTLTEVGLSLLASCLNYWLDAETDCPHVFVSTHFHSLRSFLNNPALVSNKIMSVVTEKDGALKFLYELNTGVCDYSYASYMAKKRGVSKSVVKRAEEVCEALKSGKSLLEVLPRPSAVDEQDVTASKASDKSSIMPSDKTADKTSEMAIDAPQSVTREHVDNEKKKQQTLNAAYDEIVSREVCL